MVRMYVTLSGDTGEVRIWIIWSGSRSQAQKEGLYVAGRPKYHRSSLKGELKTAQKLRPDTLSQQIRARTTRRDLDHDSCAWRGKSRYSIRKNLTSPR